METRTIYEELMRRTDGAILLGVTGPTRTGKSTFVKRFMETLVLPNIEDAYRAERARDELPQCGSGRTIMTSEPKFVPEEAVEIRPDDGTRLSVRLIDSVGYMIPGAVGAEEDGQPRMVTTPWFDHEIPMTEAAELGTKKVMEDHCTVGVVVTTDGTITDIPREDYVDAERRAIEDMRATGKPFVVLLNSTDPYAAAAQTMRDELAQTYGANVIATDCRAMDETEIRRILSGILSEFPVTELRFFLPDWVAALPWEHPIKSALLTAMRDCAEKVSRISETSSIGELLRTDALQTCDVDDVDLGSGRVDCTLRFPEALFYKTLSEQSGFPIGSDGDLLELLSSLAGVKQTYDAVAAAMAEVNETGYGIVTPAPSQVKLEAPQIIRKNGACAIKLKASAPSIHMTRTKQRFDVAIKRRACIV
ncbi:MAG: stage IV sporulation protein A [Oscillospiraceae bacterium]|nr:stage IV sporulation protein A [Oscillospiraceae bacterium]